MAAEGRYAYPSRKIQAQFIEFEQSMVIFRQRHARRVEHVLGTGGSPSNPRPLYA